MDQNKFRTMLKYYLSCMDAEQATQLKLRQNQEYQTYIRPNQGMQEQLFMQGLPELHVTLSSDRERKFILERSADAEFRRQVAELTKAFSSRPWFKAVESRFTIGTAHSFQGSECDVLVYSPVAAENMERHLVKFAAAQDDLINVTVTRAKNLLYIIGDIQACQKVSPGTPLCELANYAEKLQKRQRHPLNAAEKGLANILDELGLSYIPQYEIGGYRLDFLVNAASGQRYNVEVDGDIHLSANGHLVRG